MASNMAEQVQDTLDNQDRHDAKQDDYDGKTIENNQCSLRTEETTKPSETE